MKNKKSGKIRFGCVSLFFLFLVFVFVYVGYMGDAKIKMAYVGEVSDYMTHEKRATGKWAKDLKGFPRYYASKHEGRMRGSRIEFHQQNYQSMEIVQSDDKSCRFRLHLRGFWGFYPSRSIVEEETTTVK